MDVRRSLTAQSGFTLVEVVVAAAVLLTGVLGVMTMVTQASVVTQANGAREQAIGLEREIIETASSIPYDQLTNDALVPLVQASGGLSDSSTGTAGWQVRRRNTTYTIAAGVCAVDDPTDGYGPHGPAGYCRDGTGQTTPAQCSTYLGRTGSIQGAGIANTSSVAIGDCGIDLDLDGRVDGLVNDTTNTCSPACPTGPDTNPNDYKRIVVLVRWTVGLGSRYVLQSTTIPNPGQAAAPSVTGLTTTAPAMITSGTSVPFTATTNYPPAAMTWFVDGTPQGAATGSGTAWSFTWSLGDLGSGSAPADGAVLDGSYLVSAKGLDQYGSSGATRAQTIVVNRRAPYAPTNFEGGRNGSVVDFEWSANKERDIEGYRVYRQPSSGSAILVCPLQSDTSCQDPSPPSDPSLNYFVVAVDKDALGNLREGDHSTTQTVTNTNNPPSPPSGLAASTSGGNTVLVWTASPGDPDAGDSVDFYRIYRDGTSYTARYDRTQTGAQLTFTDTHTSGVQHTYWITAVDTQLAESTVVGPVTR